MRIKLDINKLDKAIDNAWAEVVARVDSTCIAVIEDPNEFSDLLFEDQDIILSGRLKESQTIDVRGNKAVWEWNPHDPNTGYAYALAVWMGFNAYGEYKYVPGRHWFFRALKRVDPITMFADELQKQGIGIRVTSNNIKLID